MKLAIYPIISITFFVLSCTVSPNAKTSYASEFNSKIENLNRENVAADSSSSIIDIFKLKQLCKQYSTSTYLSDNETSIYPTILTDGYFGSYSLFYPSNNDVIYVGQLVVANNHKPWLYDNTTDLFIEISIINKGAYIYDQLGFDSPKENFIKTLGHPLNEKDNILFFKKDKYYIATYFSENIAKVIVAGEYKATLPEIEIIKHLTNKINAIGF